MILKNIYKSIDSEDTSAESLLCYLRLVENELSSMADALDYNCKHRRFTTTE